MLRENWRAWHGHWPYIHAVSTYGGQERKISKTSIDVESLITYCSFHSAWVGGIMPLIMGNRLFIRMGLVRNKSIPDPVASRCVSAWATPVKAAIVTRGLVSSVFSYSRIRLVDSRPSMTGMEISAKNVRLTMSALVFQTYP